jgi:hypothetical protein
VASTVVMAATKLVEATSMAAEATVMVSRLGAGVTMPKTRVRVYLGQIGSRPNRATGLELQAAAQ